MEISIKLDKDFERFLDAMKEKYGEDMCTLNGLNDHQLNHTAFIDAFIDKKKNTADASIDGNANVGHKDITTLENEMAKPHLKLLAFNKIFYELKKAFGLRHAKKWGEEEWNGAFYLHDFFSTTLKPYCFAYDLTPIVNKGLFFVNQFNAQPPKHLVTYTDFIGEAVSWLSNRSSGAVGLPNFLIYSYYFWKKDCEEGYYIKSPEYYRNQEFQRIIYKLNQPYLRITQSAFTNFSIFDAEYYEALFGGLTFPDGTFAIDYLDDFMDYQKAFMEVVSDIRSQNMMTFPVLTYCLKLSDKPAGSPSKHKYVFADEDFAKWCCRHNMKWADSNFFLSKDITSLSNCCRLKSNIENLGYFNSIGGTALEVGSIKVNTINLARIAYETKDKNKYLEKLRDRVNTCLEALHVIRHIITRNIEKGLLPNYSLKLMNLSSQYNTIGISAMWEAIKYLGGTYTDEFGKADYTESGLDFAKEILKTIHDAKDQFAKDHAIDYQINLEQIPGERAAVILQEKDKLLYEDGCYDLPLYSNQWIPLGVKTTFTKKLKSSSVLDEACSGGSISHLNLAGPFTDFDMAWEMLNIVADTDVSYSAWCTRISACENNHGFYGDICPICGKPKITTYQRIVGFLTPEVNYSKERKAEFRLRDFPEYVKDQLDSGREI